MGAKKKGDDEAEDENDGDGDDDGASNKNCNPVAFPRWQFNSLAPSSSSYSPCRLVMAYRRPRYRRCFRRYIVVIAVSVVSNERRRRKTGGVD